MVSSSPVASRNTPFRNSRRGSYRSSPSRRSPNRRSSLDSPSRQLMEDLCRWQIESDRKFKERLDEQDKILAASHRKALDEAKEKHAAVLRSAERARETLQLQITNESIRRQQQEEEALEQARRDQAELEARQRQAQVERALQLEREAKAKLDADRATAEAEERTRREQTRFSVEQEQRQREATQHRELEEANRRQQAAIPIKPPPVVAPAIQQPVAAAAKKLAPTSATLSSTPLTPWEQLTNVHDQYLALHQKLKAMRKHMGEALKDAKKVPGSQVANMSDMRREVNKLLGQTTNDGKKNKSIREKIMGVFQTAWNITEVGLDAREFVINPQNPWQAGQNTQVSGVFVFLLNHLVKSAIKQMVAASTQTHYNAVDYYGVIISWMVSFNGYRVQGNSFADIVIAKFHHSCPPLFGVFGPENTREGRLRLGWRGTSEQDHFDKAHAMAMGWASTTLRDYSKLQDKTQKSAIPAWHYWQSISCITNVPANQLTKTHAVAIKGLLEWYANQFVKFYGQAAMTAMRTAVISLPAQAPDAFKTASVLRDTIARKYGIQL
ncbi:hypothetical protein BT63DRAFT_456623 [Microthyrium microscopicum]|uniref:mRNA export factor GLE1 n=1 Tax=Microthyrium microscopicum TaxID=703497 RepID=A0A6A6U4U9_9PEZI|nr:hypothetical protein BT63DRAFT_456623 [Microthyrium microscopicum]